MMTRFQEPKNEKVSVPAIGEKTFRFEVAAAGCVFLLDDAEWC
jgi:hypothetical protein